MSDGEARFVGEGQLGWIDSLGGKGVLFPVAAGLLVISALVRAKLPGSAKAQDEAAAVARARRQWSWPRALPMWLLLIVTFTAIHWMLGETP